MFCSAQKAMTSKEEEKRCNEEEKRCPLCSEEFDLTDQLFMPCQCGYQICVWCFHRIIDYAEKQDREGRCPACRTIYEKEKIVAMQADCEKLKMTKISNRKTKPPKAKQKANEVKKNLSNVRVIQRKMAYVIGLPLSLADEEVLMRKEYFGQYGKITKISLSRTAGGAIQQFANDTCSAYITYSKEEEAIRCIQSVHGFVLDGKFLKASFGTAKYCHAWLKNVPCNNPACLYLHSIGAEEDSFGKDEVAANHTRSRVQQIVGSANNTVKGPGNVLPPADDMYDSTTTSDKSTIRSGISDAAHGSASAVCDTTHPVPSKEKEGAIAVPHKMTTFVDVVGRSSSAATEKDGNISEDRKIQKLGSELSSVAISRDQRAGELYSVPSMFKISSSNCIGNGLFRNAPDEPLREDSLMSNNQGSKDTSGSSNRSFFLHPSYPANVSDDSGGRALLPKKTHSMNSFTVDPVHIREDEASLPIRSVNSMLNDSCQETGFQTSAKSDRIYRSSRSFSNEEIVEHLRRIDDDKLTSNEENSASLDAVESSIISNIMSIDLDSCEDSLTMAKHFDETDGLGGSSWSSMNSDQSGSSFVKQDGFAIQTAGPIPPEYGDNKEQYLCKPHYPVTRAPSFGPPGFTVPSRDPPPGFPAIERTGSLPHPSSGGRLGNASSLSSPALHPSSARRTSSIEGIDLFDPAILSFTKDQQTTGFNNGGFGMRPTNTPRWTPYEDEATLWQFNMKQPGGAHQESELSQMSIPHEQPRYTASDVAGNEALARIDELFGLSSMINDQENNNPSFFTQLTQQKYTNSHAPNPNLYRYNLGNIQPKGGAGMTELGSNNRLGGANRYYQGYGDCMFSSGDVYTRVFGL